MRMPMDRSRLQFFLCAWNGTNENIFVFMCFNIVFTRGMQAQTSGWRLLAGECCWLAMGWRCGHFDISMCFMHVLEACVRQWIEAADDSSCRLGTG